MDIFQVTQILNLFNPASVFAYGQTSSGKTYTMAGIMQYAVSDIYDYINEVIESTLVLLSKNGTVKDFSNLFKFI